jgi:hypothetical protein
MLALERRWNNQNLIRWKCEILSDQRIRIGYDDIGLGGDVLIMWPKKLLILGRKGPREKAVA